jgi:hypothetical protein
MRDNKYFVKNCKYRNQDFVYIAIAASGGITHADEVIELFNRYVDNQKIMLDGDAAEFGIIEAAYRNDNNKQCFINGMTLKEMETNLKRWGYDVKQLTQNKTLKWLLENDTQINELFYIVKEQRRDKGPYFYRLMLAEDRVHGEYRMALEQDMLKRPDRYFSGIVLAEIAKGIIQEGDISEETIKKFPVDQFLLQIKKDSNYDVKVNEGVWNVSYKKPVEIDYRQLIEHFSHKTTN